MALITWAQSPFEAMDRLFRDSIGDLTAQVSRNRGAVEGAYVPNVDISEDKTNFYILAELPGMEEGDVKVNIDDDVLIISGKKIRQAEKKERTYHTMERSVGEFVRSLSLPTNVKAELITGTFRNGLLELTLPKMVTDTSGPREIPLNAGTNVKQNGQSVHA